MYWVNYFLILILCSGALIICIIFLNRRKHSTLTNLVLMILSIFLILMTVEFYFKNFFAEHPDIRRLSEAVKISLEDINVQNALMINGEDDAEDIVRHLSSLLKNTDH